MKHRAPLPFALLLVCACRAEPTPQASPAEPSQRAAPGDAHRSEPERAPTFSAQPGWTAQVPASATRVAQYALTPAGGDATPASVVVTYFGVHGAGTFDQNIERWCEHFEQPDGRPSRDVARIEKRSFGDWNASVFEIDGRYVAPLAPGSSEHYDEPDWAMVNVVIETGAGPYYAKLVGPRATVEHWRESFDRFLADS